MWGWFSGWCPKTTPTPGFTTAIPKDPFSAMWPNQKLVTDITYIDTVEGWLDLSVILDLLSRRAVGLVIDKHMETKLVKAALNMALGQRQFASGWLHHSDQGSQYTSSAYRQLLSDAGSLVSMSGVGNCYDNAVMESFFSTHKFECASERFPTRKQAKLAIFEYIEVWYNRKRLRSSLDYLSPVKFEQAFLDIFCAH